MYVGKPKNDLSSCVDVGSFMLLMEFTFSGSALAPSLDRIMPKNFIESTAQTLFFLFSVSPSSWILLSSAFKFSWCSSVDFPQTMISSEMFLTPFKPHVTFCSKVC